MRALTITPMNSSFVIINIYDTEFLEILPNEETADELTSNFNVLPRTRFDLQPRNRPTELQQLDIHRLSMAAHFRLLCKEQYYSYIANYLL